MSRFSLIPREEKFYDDFRAFADQLRVGARLLQELFANEPPDVDKVHEIKESEHKCDFLTHEIIQRLNKTFVTPIDREDIHEIARTLDDVMDAIDDAAALIPLYRITKIRPGARELAVVIAAQCDELRKGIEALEKRDGVLSSTVEINRLENEADRIGRSAVADLFNKEKDPITIIKLKEVYEFIEATIDSCEDVADVLQNVVVKNN